MKARIAVLGSINMDFVAEVKEFPRLGETVLGRNLHQFPGGKGANQAVAAAKAGADVSMYGLLGKDGFTDQLKESLQEVGINIDNVETRPVSTGVALITVNAKGDNQIIIVPGANKRVSRSYVDQVLDQIRNVEVVLLQLEIPLETVKYTLSKLTSRELKVILDPAPALSLKSLPLENVDILTPNETELNAIIKGSKTKKGIRGLFDRGLKSLIITKGKAGSLFISKKKRFFIPSFKVNSVDTTAAGDAFNGALAVAVGEGKPIKDALKFANAAGAIACSRRGAQPSLPERKEITKLLKRQE